MFTLVLSFRIRSLVKGLISRGGCSALFQSLCLEHEISGLLKDFLWQEGPVAKEDGEFLGETQQCWFLYCRT